MVCLVTRTLSIALVAVFAASGCHVPDTLTAVEHEEIATQRHAAADQARAAVRVQETTQPLPSGSESVGDAHAPMAEFPAGRAGREEALADEHERAAKRIRHDAEVACLHVAPSERRFCPIPKLDRVERTPLGVRLYPAPGVEPERLAAELRCAVAEAHVDRPNDAASCPLYAPGASVHVQPKGAALAIEIGAPDEPSAAEIRRRAEAFHPAAAPVSPPAQ